MSNFVWTCHQPSTILLAHATSSSLTAMDRFLNSLYLSSTLSYQNLLLKPDSCQVQHDPSTMFLSILIAIGLLLSYLPQHYRILSARSSQGISPWFLLLGSTSSTSSLANVLTLQWGLVKCCRVLSAGECAESVLGIVQVFLQWACFNIMLVLSLIYFPPEEKYVRVVPADGSKARSRASSASSSFFDPADALPPSTRLVPLTLSKEYALARTLAAVVLVHCLASAAATLALLALLPSASPHSPSPSPHHPSTRLLHLWASTSGILSMLLAAAQYFPQIAATFHRGLVGSLSLPMMLVQTPGSFVFVYSLAARPGVDWTTWIVYLVSGILQGVLLVMCIVWKIKQRQAGIDDWGNPICSFGSGAGLNDQTRQIESSGSESEAQGIRDHEGNQHDGAPPGERSRLLSSGNNKRTSFSSTSHRH